VVAIGGILAAEHVRAAASCGADGVCVVRALGDEPALAMAPLLAALRAAPGDSPPIPPALPHPSLDPEHT
jgi:hydroxymethylpyrimidine kinase/phosphomethylpyrimidine kinase/thiamine-phosphate diphosphorylase